jgi:hypothetical protein
VVSVIRRLNIYQESSAHRICSQSRYKEFPQRKSKELHCLDRFHEHKKKAIAMIKSKWYYFIV